MIGFRTYLRGQDADALEQAWNEYRNQPDLYFSGGEAGKKKRYREEMRERIQNLLEIAK